jgi:hypothetical protein
MRSILLASSVAMATAATPQATVEAAREPPHSQGRTLSAAQIKAYLPCYHYLATGVTDIIMKWNPFAGQYGQYEVQGCEGVSPQLYLKESIEYTFSQNDVSNWYHPVGFAIEAGGAHAQCPPLSGPECPEVEGRQYLQYFVNDAPAGNTADLNDFGLNDYEPLFFNSRDNWSKDTYHAKLKVPANGCFDVACYKKIFYFCHIHNHMNGEIIIVSDSYSPPAQPALTADGYACADAMGGCTDQLYDVNFEKITLPSSFDLGCGTWDSEPYSNDHGSCTGKKFLCGAGAQTSFSQCLEAADCQMHHEMATQIEANDGPLVSFAKQMIPHHANAVAQAKSLMKYMTTQEAAGLGLDYDEYYALAQEIVVAQNAQIGQLMAVLKYESTPLCYDNHGGGDDDDDDGDDDDGKKGKKNDDDEWWHDDDEPVDDRRLLF